MNGPLTLPSPPAPSGGLEIGHSSRIDTGRPNGPLELSPAEAIRPMPWVRYARTSGALKWAREPDICASLQRPLCAPIH